jgi:hypothetical protein
LYTVFIGAYHGIGDKMAEKPHSTKGYILRYANNFRRITGQPYIINWAADGMVIKRIISKLGYSKTRKLIDFCFTNHPSTQYFRSQGFPLRLLPQQANQLLAAMGNPGIYIPDDELDLDIPFWEDERLRRLWQLILRSDLESLKSEFRGESVWHLLIAKIQRQDGFVPEQVQYLFDLWKSNETIERRAIQHERGREC